MTAALRHPVLWFCVVLVALTLLWQAIGAPVSLITQIAIYTLYGAGVNLLVGYTGLVPFGASVFFGCASYAVAISMRGFLGNEIAALVFAVLFSLALAAAIALIILRRRGLYFSLLTLAFSQIAFEIAFKWTDLTGGENGMQNVPRPWLHGDWTFHVFTVVTVAGGLWLLWCIAHAPFGRVLAALRDNEQRVLTLGYSTFRLKFEAFVIMGGVVGYAGALLAVMLRGAYADNLELAARRRRAADDGAGRRAPVPRPAVGRDRLHSAAGPTVDAHRKLVADVRADRHRVRARLARGHGRPGAATARAAGMDADTARHPAASRSDQEWRAPGQRRYGATRSRSGRS